MGDDPDIGGYIGGVCVALLSTTTNATGLFLQKSTHKRREAESGPKKSVWREPRWLLGLGCLFAGSMMSLAVFALLGQSRASAMAAITIAINAIFSTWCLGERFTIIDLATTALIGTAHWGAAAFRAARFSHPHPRICIRTHAHTHTHLLTRLCRRGYDGSSGVWVVSGWP